MKISEELLCPICYINPTDTFIHPCEHSKIPRSLLEICEKCIVIHMTTNRRCPFCNVGIKKTIRRR